MDAQVAYDRPGVVPFVGSRLEAIGLSYHVSLSATHGMRALVPVRRGAPESPSIEPKDLPRAEVLIIIDPGAVPVILKMPPLRRGRCARGVEKAGTFAAAEPYAGADNPIRALRAKACGKGLAVCCSAAISRLPRPR